MEVENMGTPTVPARDSFRFDGEFHYIDQSAVTWEISWVVRDDYDQLVWREGRCDLGDGRGMVEWLDPEFLALDLPEGLKRKVEDARAGARRKIMDGLSAPGVRELAVYDEEAGLGVGGLEDEAMLILPAYVKEAWTTLALTCTDKGAPILNADNVLRALDGTESIKGRVWWDEFSQQISTNFGGAVREWSDHDTRGLWMEFQRRLGLARVSKDAVFEGLVEHAWRNRRHPVKEWLAHEQWDGVERLDTFFRDYMGAEDSAYMRAVSRNFFVAMIARVFVPGCKVDNMVVLEGSQGAKKSSALKALCGEWFTECNEPISNGNNKDFYAVLQGKMLVEIAELDSFSRADIRRIKAIITTATDRYRPPYGRLTQNFPRTSVFVGTTNEDEYLEDATGGRRFWPVKIGTVRLDEIGQDRSLLFAEALARYRARPTWWEVPAEAAEKQEHRRKQDAWEETIEQWCSAQLFDITSRKIALDALGFTETALHDGILKRIAYCMKCLGYKLGRLRTDGGRIRIWVKAQ